MGLYWEQKGRLYEEYKELYDKHVPAMGSCETLAGEVLRASSRIYYDAFNNGFCNNTTGAWNFLQQYVPSKNMKDALKVLEDCVNCSCNDYWMTRYDAPEDTPPHPIAAALETLAEEATIFAMTDYAQEQPAPCDLFDLQDPDEYPDDEEEDDSYGYDEDEDDDEDWR